MKTVKAWMVVRKSTGEPYQWRFRGDYTTAIHGTRKAAKKFCMSIEEIVRIEIRPLKPKRPRSITLKQAHKQALKVGRDTQQRLDKERRRK